MNKSPLQRLQELTKILKNDDNLVPYTRLLSSGFCIQSIWQPRKKVIFLMPHEQEANKIIYLEEGELDVEELLEIVKDLENML
jgi:hypothetical protein